MVLRARLCLPQAPEVDRALVAWEHESEEEAIAELDAADLRRLSRATGVGALEAPGPGIPPWGAPGERRARAKRVR